MNYTICLDPYSLNFTPSELSGNGFAVYTDADNFTSPIAVNIPASSIFSPPLGNCSVTLNNIPNNANQILVVDQCDGLPPSTPGAPDAPSYTCCYALLTIPDECISWCEECSITFDTFQTSSIGKLVAGNLTSTCGTVTDYVIGWYLDGDYSAPALTTGFGSSAGPYQFGPHPLTGNNAVPVVGGSWEGIIHDIVINGTLYSNVASGSKGGTPIPFESCFDTIVVDPLSCNNGTALGKYSHQYNFNSQTSGTLPVPTSLTYALDSTTKYFAYAFKGLSVWDELEIKWISGDPNATSNPSLYSQPIYLEKLQLGLNVTPDSISNQTPNLASNLWDAVDSTTTISNLNNIWPKKYPGDDYFQRVLTLTNLETSSNPSAPDYLEITVSPNTLNNNTQWQAGFQCLTDFDCTNCYYEDYPDNIQKIFSISLNKTYTCPTQQLNVNFTGCLIFPESPPPSDLINLSINNAGINNPNINLVGSKFSPLSSFGQQVSLVGQIQCSPAGPGSWNSTSPNWTFGAGHLGLVCSDPSNSTITLNKTPNSIKLTFNSENDYLHYKNNLINTVLAYNPNFTTPKVCSTTNTDYFQVFGIFIPNQSSGADCGDNTTIIKYFFHVNDYLNTTYVENSLNNIWSIEIPQTLMTNCYGYSSCSTCFSITNIFTLGYNSHVNSQTSFSYTTTTGAKYTQPFTKYGINRNIVGGASGSFCNNVGSQWNISIPWYGINTVPFISSSNGWINLPSLGNSLPCDISMFPKKVDHITGILLASYYGSYQVVFPHLTSSFDYSLSTNDFEIYSLTGPACPVTGSFINFYNPSYTCPTGSLIYSYIGGVATMHDSRYFWQGNAPTLYIAP
jgi:hypothetical protein